MGYISDIFRRSEAKETMSGEVEPLPMMPKEIAELLARKKRALGDKIPKPNTPESVIEARFDRQIKEAWSKYGGTET